MFSLLPMLFFDWNYNMCVSMETGKKSRFIKSTALKHNIKIIFFVTVLSSGWMKSVAWEHSA